MDQLVNEGFDPYTDFVQYAYLRHNADFDQTLGIYRNSLTPENIRAAEALAAGALKLIDSSDAIPISIDQIQIIQEPNGNILIVITYKPGLTGFETQHQVIYDEGIADFSTEIEITDAGVLVHERDQPGDWFRDSYGLHWDDNGNGVVDSNDGEWTYGAAPPLRPEGLGIGGGAGQISGINQGNSTNGATALAPAVAVRPQIRPKDLNAGSSGSSSNDDDDDRGVSFNGGTYDPNKVVTTDGGTKVWLKDLNPILLDLDGNGIQLTDLTRSTVFMAGDEGLKHRTAWAGAGDGVLFYDTETAGQAGFNEISDIREYVFTEWDPTAKDDLAALRSRFDTNGDGKLTGTELNGFKVMRTNADGSLTAQTMAQLGITQINLTEDTTQIALSDGSQITGQGTFVIGGVTRTLANATLMAEADGSRVVETASVTGGVRTVVQTGYGATGYRATRRRGNGHVRVPQSGRPRDLHPARLLA